jgi:hypothetical protein
MSTWCEIVRYRANMQAVFTLIYDKNVLGPRNYLNGVKNTQCKTRCFGILTSDS